MQSSVDAVHNQQVAQALVDETFARRAPQAVTAVVVTSVQINEKARNTRVEIEERGGVVTRKAAGLSRAHPNDTFSDTIGIEKAVWYATQALRKGKPYMKARKPKEEVPPTAASSAQV